MAGVGGFFVKGLASGFLQGQQIQEMNWQRKEKERIKKEEDAFMETLTMAGKKFSSYYADYNVSEDERLQAIATWSALSYEAKELLKGAYDGVMNYNKEAEEQTLATVKAYREAIEGIDFDSSTIPEISDYFRGQIKSPNGLKYFDAADRLLKKQYEAKQVKEPTMGNYATGLKYLKDIVNVPSENWESARKGLESKFGFDYSAITQESLREAGPEVFNLYNTPEEVMANVKAVPGTTVIPTRDTKTGKYYGSFSKETIPTPPTPPTAPSIENIREDIFEADTLEDARRIEKNHIAKYGDTLDIPDVDKYWAEGQTIYLDKIKTSIGNIIDEKGWLKKGTLTSAEVGIDFKGEQPAEEVYKKLYEEYTKYRDMLEKMGVDLSQFPKLKPLEEIEKVGLGEGFWGWGKQKGQYKSIYE